MAAYDAAGQFVVDFAPVLTLRGCRTRSPPLSGVAASGGGAGGRSRWCDHCRESRLLIHAGTTASTSSPAAPPVVAAVAPGTSAVRLTGPPAASRCASAARRLWMVPPLGAWGGRRTVHPASHRGHRRPGPLTPAEVATIDTMCGHLEGIPLAIELAAVPGTDPWRRPGRRHG